MNKIKELSCNEITSVTGGGLGKNIVVGAGIGGSVGFGLGYVAAHIVCSPFILVSAFFGQQSIQNTITVVKLFSLEVGSFSAATGAVLGSVATMFYKCCHTKKPKKIT